MLKTIFTILIIFTLTFINSLYAQTISSTPTGGLWGSGSIWVGGVVQDFLF
ncbi:MAG: hypothetical protein QME25_02230 [Bacteroidota bacterium]|nr:hypothetical protein [Bacteroidota bacterium]